MDQSSGNTGGNVANSPSAGLIVAYVCLGAGAILLVIAIVVILYLTCKGKLYKKTKVRREEVVLVEDVNGNPAMPVARSVIVSEKGEPVRVMANSLPRHHHHHHARGLDTTDSRPVVVRTLPRGSTILSVKSEKPYKVKSPHTIERRKWGKGAKAMSVQSLPRSRSLKDIQGENKSMFVPVKTVYATSSRPKTRAKRAHRNGPAYIYSSAPALYTLPRGNRLLHMDKGAQHHVTRWLHSHPQPRKPASVAGGGVTMATGRPYVYTNPIYANSDPGDELDHTLDHVDSSDVKLQDMSYDTNSLFLRWSPNMRRKRDDSSGIYSTSQRSFDIGSHTITRVPEYQGSRSYLSNGNVRLESL